MSDCVIEVECTKCKKRVRTTHLVEGINVISQKGFLWCPHCATVTYQEGQPVVAEDSQGKLKEKRLLCG